MLVLSLYFQQVLHDSPLMTGLAIAPQGIVVFVAGALGGRLAARMGTRWLPVLTNGVATFGFLAHTPPPGHCHHGKPRRRNGGRGWRPGCHARRGGDGWPGHAGGLV